MRRASVGAIRVARRAGISFAAFEDGAAKDCQGTEAAVRNALYTMSV